MGVEAKDFCFEHLDLFAWREEDRKTYNVSSEFVQAFIGADERMEAYTGLVDGRIVVIGGIMPITKKTGYCFTMFSKYADDHKLAVARIVRRMFYRMFEDMGMHRVTTYNRVGAEEHDKWCEWLGFIREGNVPMFDDEGNDYVQYGYTKKRVSNGD